MPESIQIVNGIDISAGNIAEVELIFFFQDRFELSGLAGSHLI
jgi:hypothetical protein